MIGRLAALILLSTLSRTQEVPEQMPFTVAALGDNFTLICSVNQKEFGLLYWYKLRIGYRIQTVASGPFARLSLKGQFDNPRFTVEKVNAEHILNIRNVSKEDEATYVCQGGTAYTMDMINSTHLAVIDHKNLQKSDYVTQRPEAVSVGPGSSVTLECSFLSENKEIRDQCLDEHRIYWFRTGPPGFNTGVVHTASSSTGVLDRRSCVYSLSKTVRDSSDAGTYYCAVVMCGHILFGEGTKVETRQDLWPIITLGILLMCCVIVIIILIVSKKQKHVSESWNGSINPFSHGEQTRSDENNMNGERGPLNYATLDFPSRRPKRLRNKVELPEESLYSLINSEVLYSSRKT